LDKSDEMQPLKYHSLYRGEVLDREDPLRLGRLKVLVYQVYHNIGIESIPWAWPMMPASNKAGFIHIPPVGATVWAMFEMGDPDHPVWSNGWWGAPGGANETPDEVFQDLSPDGHVWRTPSGHIIILDERDGEEKIQIKDSNGNHVTLNTAQQKLEIYQQGNLETQVTGNGNVQINGNATVVVNGNADVQVAGVLSMRAALIQEN